MTRWRFMLIGLVAGLATVARAEELVTMTFATLTSGVSVHEENQLRLSAEVAMFVSSTSLPDPPGMISSAIAARFTLTALHGGTFDMSSIDMRELNSTLGAQSLTFVGTREDNTTVQVSVTTDGVCCEPVDNFGVQTFDLSALSGLVSLQWSTPLLAYDDIVVTLIPPDPVFADRFEL